MLGMFDATIRMDDTQLFSSDSMISLEPQDLADINNGKQVIIQRYMSGIPDGSERYVYDGTCITNIVRREGDVLIAVRKI